MRISIGSDHAGFELKEELKGLLIRRGQEVDKIRQIEADNFR